MYITDLIDVKTIILMLGLDMKEHSSYYIGLCPFHLEKTPSFSIKKKGFFKCFGCGKSGTMNSLVFQLTGKSIYKFLGVQDLSSFYFENSIKSKKEKERVSFEVKPLEIKGTFEEIQNNLNAKNYIELRRVPKEFINFFDIVYSNYTIINGTEFKKRIMIPIYEDGKLTGYEGRSINSFVKPKVLYNKGASVSTLFNIDNLDREKPLIVCEGTWDIPQIFCYINQNSTHTFGAAISNKQKKLLNEFKEIILFLDNDEAGENVALQFDSFYEKEFLITKPPKEGQDPGDLTLEQIKECLNRALPSVEYFLNKSKLFEEEEIKW